MSRGWNWETQQGNNETWNLTGRQTDIPNGTYCNVAAFGGPLVGPAQWTNSCPSCLSCSMDKVKVINGTVATGSVPSGGMVAIHLSYRDGTDEAEDGEVEIAETQQGEEPMSGTSGTVRNGSPPGDSMATMSSAQLWER